MDVLSIPNLKKFYRVLASPKGLRLIEISEKDSKLKILKIKNKKLLKGGKTQLNFHDGKNLIVEKEVYKTGDSVLVELPSMRIVESLKLEKGITGMIIKGKNAGKLAEVKNIVISRTLEPNKVVCECENKKLEVTIDHFFVIGKKSPLIEIGE